MENLKGKTFGKEQYEQKGKNCAKYRQEGLGFNTHTFFSTPSSYVCEKKTNDHGSESSKVYRVTKLQ
jgi:hypothetical protein